MSTYIILIDINTEMLNGNSEFEGMKEKIDDLENYIIKCKNNIDVKVLYFQLVSNFDYVESLKNLSDFYTKSEFLCAEYLKENIKIDDYLFLAGGNADQCLIGTRPCSYFMYLENFDDIFTKSQVNQLRKEYDRYYKDKKVVCKNVFILDNFVFQSGELYCFIRDKRLWWSSNFKIRHEITELVKSICKTFDTSKVINKYEYIKPTKSFTDYEKSVDEIVDKEKKKQILDTFKNLLNLFFK